MANNISPLAFVHKEARLGNNVTVGPFVFIDRNVVVGDNCEIRAHVTLLPGTRLGEGNKVYENAVISADPQDFRWKGGDSFTEIGNNNVIRENVVINRSSKPGGATKIGNSNWIMAQTHIGHDTDLTNQCVIGTGCRIAGDLRISHCAILSSGVIVHEHCNIGPWALIKGGSRVTGNVPPYVIMAHNPISYFGVNAFLLKRGQKSDDIINDIAKCYRHLYQSNTSTENAVRRIKVDVSQSKERDSILKFLEMHDNKIVASPLDIEE